MRPSHLPNPISSPARAGVHRLDTEQVVGAGIERIFAYRRDVIARVLG